MLTINGQPMTYYAQKPQNPKDDDTYFDNDTGQTFIYSGTRWWLLSNASNEFIEKQIENLKKQEKEILENFLNMKGLLQEYKDYIESMNLLDRLKECGEKI